MNRKKHEVNNVRIADEEYGRLENKFDLLRNEVNGTFDEKKYFQVSNIHMKI